MRFMQKVSSIQHYNYYYMEHKWAALAIELRFGDYWKDQNFEFNLLEICLAIRRMRLKGLHMFSHGENEWFLEFLLGVLLKK